MSILTQRQGIQAYIIAHLQTIDGVQNVYGEYQRATSMADVVDKFSADTTEGDGTVLQFWTVRRIGANLHTRENDRGVPVRVGLNTHLLFELKLYYAYREGVTEDEFQDLIDNVLDGFKEERSLGDWNTTGPLSMFNTITDGYMKQIYWHQATFRVTAIAIENDLAPH